MGVPVITINSRGCKEVVRDEVDGLVLKSFGVKDLQEAMKDLLLDGEKLGRLAKNAWEGRDRFSRKHFIDEQLEIYERLGINSRSQS